MSVDKVREMVVKYAVCISNYDTENTIEQSLGSILPQVSSEDFEIIVVDNLSKDRSASILKNLENKA